MRSKPLAALAIAASVAALAGCGQPEAKVPGPKATPIQSSTAAESGTAQSLNAVTQALVDHATVSTSGDQPTGFAVRKAEMGESGYMRQLDLASTASVDLTVHLEDVTDAAGHRKYPDLSGTLTVHATGEVVSSWPTGSDVLAHHTITVGFDHVAYHDRACGVTAVLTSGSYTYDLETSYHYASAENWTAAFDAELVVPSTSPLLWSASRPDGATRTVAVFGARDGHLRLARVNDTGTGGTTDRLVVDAAIDGTHGDPATSSTLDGVTGVDPGAPADSYTNWDLLVDGTEHLVWNRRAALHAQWDFAPTGATLTASGSDRVWITINGATSGPYTADQLKAQHHCTLDE